MKILTVPRFSGRIRVWYTESVNDLRMPPFFSVTGRLRACLFDLGSLERVCLRGYSAFGTDFSFVYLDLECVQNNSDRTVG
jgi:hypothetical protein